MITCTTTYAIPMQRITDAHWATTDLRVVIAGPAGALMEALAAGCRAA